LYRKGKPPPNNRSRLGEFISCKACFSAEGPRKKVGGKLLRLTDSVLEGTSEHTRKKKTVLGSNNGLRNQKTKEKSSA